MRQVFTTIDELVTHLKTNPSSKQVPYKVELDGMTIYTLSGNTDQAIATLARKLGASAEAVPISVILSVETLSPLKVG